MNQVSIASSPARLPRSTVSVFVTRPHAGVADERDHGRSVVKSFIALFWGYAIGQVLDLR